MRSIQKFCFYAQKFRGERNEFLIILASIGVAITNCYNSRHQMRANAETNQGESESGDENDNRVIEKFEH